MITFWMTTFWFLCNIKHHNHATFMNQKVVIQILSLNRLVISTLVQRCFEPSFRFNRTIYFALCPIHFGKQQHNVCKKVVLCCAAAVACNSWDLSTWLSWEEEGNELSSKMAEPVAAAARRHTRRRHASVVMMATLLGKGAPWLYSPIHGLRTYDD